MTTPSTSELIDAVDEVFTETIALARELSPSEGLLPTDCPGWTVHDNLAHMVGLEQALGGAGRLAKKEAELAPFIEAALARKQWMQPLADDEIPLVPAAVRKPQVPDAEAQTI